MRWENLLKVEYETPLASIGVRVIKTLSHYCHKVDDHQYVLASKSDGNDVLKYYGFLWSASDGTAEWIVTGNSLADDGVNICPPDCLLPKPGMTSHQEIVGFGHDLDPLHFSSVVVRQAQVSFAGYTYFYRKITPSPLDFPIGIKLDLRPMEDFLA